MKKFVLPLVLFLFAFVAAQAQTQSYRGSLPANHPDAKPFTFKHGIGLGASMMSGYGFSYQYHITPKQRLEATAFLYLNSHNDIADDYGYEYDEKDWYGNIAFEYHYLLAERRFAKLFAMVGAGYMFNRSEYDWNDDYYYYDYDNDMFNSWQAGSGFVIEFFARDLNLTFNLDLGFCYRYSEDYYQNKLESTDQYFGFAIGGGIYYTF
jgi:hypothetical protein